MGDKEDLIFKYSGKSWLSLLHLRIVYYLSIRSYSNLNYIKRKKFELKPKKKLK